MRFELSFLERAYHANRLRARATELRKLIEERSASSTAQELRQEIAYLEEQARRLDDAEEPAAVSEKEPTVLDRAREDSAVNYINPKAENGK